MCARFGVLRQSQTALYDLVHESIFEIMWISFTFFLFAVLSDLWKHLWCSRAARSKADVCELRFIFAKTCFCFENSLQFGHKTIRNGFPVWFYFPNRLEGYFLQLKGYFVLWEPGKHAKDISYWKSPKKWRLDWTTTCWFCSLIRKFLLSFKIPHTSDWHIVSNSSAKKNNWTSILSFETKSSPEFRHSLHPSDLSCLLRAADFVIAKHHHCAVDDRENIEIYIKRILSSTKPTISSSNIVLITLVEF